MGKSPRLGLEGRTCLKGIVHSGSLAVVLAVPVLAFSGLAVELWASNTQAGAVATEGPLLSGLLAFDAPASSVKNLESGIAGDSHPQATLLTDWRYTDGKDDKDDKDDDDDDDDHHKHHKQSSPCK